MILNYFKVNLKIEEKVFITIFEIILLCNSEYNSILQFYLHKILNKFMKNVCSTVLRSRMPANQKMHLWNVYSMLYIVRWIELKHSSLPWWWWMIVGRYFARSLYKYLAANLGKISSCKLLNYFTIVHKKRIELQKSH